jgi:ligand-binding SRPBCC domain-containing protein
MVKGAFKSFVHDHHFEEQDGATTMRDVLQFSSPFGFVGSVVDRIFMTGYLERLIVRRCEAVKRVAERQHAEAEQPG